VCRAASFSFLIDLGGSPALIATPASPNLDRLRDNSTSFVRLHGFYKAEFLMPQRIRLGSFSSINATDSAPAVPAATKSVISAPVNPTGCV